MNDMRAATIEIVERRNGTKNSIGIIVPNSVRINGQSVAMSADDPIVIHEIDSNDLVKVTLTLVVGKLVIAAEDAEVAE